MHPATAKKVLTDEETLDIAKTAEAVQEVARLRAKKEQPKGNAAKAHTAKVIRQFKEEEFRQKVAKIWNKRKKV